MRPTSSPTDQTIYWAAIQDNGKDGTSDYEWTLRVRSLRVR